MSPFSTRSPRRAATVVEFALLLPVFCLILFGILEFGWVSFQRNALTSAAYAGCRAAALVDPGVGDVDLDQVYRAAQDTTIATLEAVGGVACAGTCRTTITTLGEAPGRTLLCHVERDLPPLVGLVAGTVILDVDMAARMEWQR